MTKKSPAISVSFRTMVVFPRPASARDPNDLCHFWFPGGVRLGYCGAFRLRQRFLRMLTYGKYRSASQGTFGLSEDLLATPIRTPQIFCFSSSNLFFFDFGGLGRGGFGGGFLLLSHQDFVAGHGTVDQFGPLIPSRALTTMATRLATTKSIQ